MIRDCFRTTLPVVLLLLGGPSDLRFAASPSRRVENADTCTWITQHHRVTTIGFVSHALGNAQGRPEKVAPAPPTGHFKPLLDLTSAKRCRFGLVPARIATVLLERSRERSIGKRSPFSHTSPVFDPRVPLQSSRSDL